jgi:hypothetical protein
MAATQLKRHLDLLYEELRLARENGLVRDPRYMADLGDELEDTLHAYTVARVVEIASERGLVRHG